MTQATSLTTEDATLGTPVIYVGRETAYRLRTQIISQVQVRDGQPHVLVANIGNWVPLTDLQKGE